MNKFIRLHNRNNNTPIIVSTKNIICVFDKVRDNQICGNICVDGYGGRINTFSVNETSEKVFNLTNSDEFIKLHQYSNNLLITVNTNYIVLIDYDEDKCKSISSLYLDGKDGKLDAFNINETPEKIYSMITNTKE